MTSIYMDDASSWSTRFPGPKGFIAGFGATTGTTDAILASTNNALLMVVVQGVDVLASSSGTGTEQFTVDLWDGGGNHFVGTLFGNQVSPPTGLNFSWRGLFPVYSNQQLKLHSVAGGWSASIFGFLTTADNLPH